MASYCHKHNIHFHNVCPTCVRIAMDNTPPPESEPETIAEEVPYDPDHSWQELEIRDVPLEDLKLVVAELFSHLHLKLLRCDEYYGPQYKIRRTQKGV